MEVADYTRQEQNTTANPKKKCNSEMSAAQALQQVIDAWPRLPEAIRQTILAQLR